MLQNQINADFTILRLILFKIVQGSSEEFRSKEEWYGDAHALALKLFRHVTTIYQLSQPSAEVLPGIPHLNPFIDFSATQILARSVIETFLIFSYIFHTETPSLSKFRNQVWRLSGLGDRQKLDAFGNEGKLKLAAEKADIDKLIAEIRISPHLLEYTENQRVQILSGHWSSKIKKWPDLATSAGFNKTYFNNVYSHLCGQSHASYICAMQVTQARNITSMQQLANFCISQSAFIMAWFIKQFSEISSTASEYLVANIPEKIIVDRWAVTADEWSELYADF